MEFGQDVSISTSVLAECCRMFSNHATQWITWSASLTAMLHLLRSSYHWLLCNSVEKVWNLTRSHLDGMQTKTALN